MGSEEGMSCAEFLYPLFQAFDYLHLHTQHNCWLQVLPMDGTPAILTVI